MTATSPNSSLGDALGVALLLTLYLSGELHSHRSRLLLKCPNSQGGVALWPRVPPFPSAILSFVCFIPMRPIRSPKMGLCHILYLHPNVVFLSLRLFHTARAAPTSSPTNPGRLFFFLITCFAHHTSCLTSASTIQTTAHRTFCKSCLGPSFGATLLSYSFPLPRSPRSL
jgi:hypothetical protein